MIDESYMNITRYDVLGKLPDPFQRADGSRLASPDEWDEHRRELYKTAVELQYGTMPPPPEFLELELLYRGKETETYRITTGRRDHPINFMMRIMKPAGKPAAPMPAVVDGDLCFNYAFDKAWYTAFTRENICLAFFNRTELAHDIQHEGRRQGQLYAAYPEYTFGALGAWAWGYSRCVDALEKLDYIDKSCIAFTGHSRGGKTAALAGALDERAAIVNPNETNAGSCSCYRIHMAALVDGVEKRSETLADLWRNFDFWLGPQMGDYTQRENELPFDCHFLKALIAPRTLFLSEAADDLWGSPIGAWMTTQAVGEVYKFLGAPENLIWYFRPGPHFHDLEDVRRLINVIKHKYEGKPLEEGFFRTPFVQPELIYDWKAPESK